MRFYLQDRESSADAVVRIFGELLSSAQHDLTEPQADPDAAVHAVRKSMKKLRALLRLVRPVIKGKAFRTADRAVRRLARQLGGARDSTVMLSAFDQLVEHFSPFLNDAAYTPVRQVLANRYQVAIEQRLSSMDYDSLRSELHNLERLLTQLDLGEFSEKKLLGSVQKTYRQGRGELAALRADPSTEHGHAMRKQAKYLWYQLRLLRKSNDIQHKQLVQELNELGEILGHDHDLAVLSDTLQRQPDICCNAIRSELVTGLIETRRVALLSAALRLADKIYAQKPKRFLSGLRNLTVTAPR
ncbi:MAG: CHAD domain-containing protein [Gammaproteobacteria bacterium]|nr:CHAD domain-containing protein [Gammaproteobacteria bacterium]